MVTAFTPRAKGIVMNHFPDLFAEVCQWQKATFRDATPRSKIAHLRKEVEELNQRPDDDHEYADCMLLLIGAWGARGKSAAELVQACRDKLDINRARKWGRPDQSGVVEHLE